MTAFIVGILIGAIIGAIGMCIVQINEESDHDDAN